MNVERLMTKDVRTCRPEDGLTEAARAMWERDCGCVPVVDESHRVVGMITDRDVCMAAYTRGSRLQDIRIDEVMSRRVLSCQPDTPLADAEATMRSGRVRRLPVVDDAGQLLGLVSLADIAQEAARQHGARRREVKDAEVGATLVEITRPWNVGAGE
jgi:CBS domain-containing protein